MPPLHLSTILASAPSTLLSQITRLGSKYGGKGHTVLFTLSNNFAHADDLQTVVNELTTFNDNSHGIIVQEGAETKAKCRTLGCLVDSFSSVKFLGSPTGNVSGNRDVLSCSIGVFESNFCVPFHSELLGRTEPQVGRWHAFRNKGSLTTSSSESKGDSSATTWEPDWGRMDIKQNSGDNAGEVDWEDIWSRSTSNTSSSSTSELLPDALRGIDPAHIQTVFTLSSPHPDTLTHVLSESLPESSALTLIASPTHFTTGRGVTLFLDGHIYGEGAIGLALLNDGTSNDAPSWRTEFLGVKTLSGPMTITSREGNMVNELNGSNPTKLLIAALGTTGTSPSSQLANASPTTPHFKDEEQFALGVISSDGQWSSTYKITAGDPSSRGGSLSLDAPSAPEVGSVVQFLRFSSTQALEIPPSFNTSSPEHNDTIPRKKLAVLTVPEPSESSVPDSHSLRILADTFLVPSTKGFIFSPGNTSTYKPSTWTCSLPGGSVIFEWK
ncbi:hypothetical protein CVT25_001339 [Psilocybe cyanescens]|uniref:FIST domain-containing protein n=1 Tax=Psilocybe cyanescens TaxID=93625 RepID=A0A409XET9_PSICY|nr:hypothetical protein CVT25_001339 [Psilocybe cyanescens]